jgi:hypothetical protein
MGPDIGPETPSVRVPVIFWVAVVGQVDVLIVYTLDDGDALAADPPTEITSEVTAIKNALKIVNFAFMYFPSPCWTASSRSVDLITTG